MLGGFSIARAAHVSQPLLVDAPFTTQMPPYGADQCCKVCPCIYWDIKRKMPLVRGVPKDSVPVDAGERQSILQQIEGTWKIQPPFGATGMPRVSAPYGVYTDAVVRDGCIEFSGGMSRAAHGERFENSRIKTPLNFRRGSDGALYADNVGSILDLGHCEAGQVVWDTGYGNKLVLMRPGMTTQAPAQQSMPGMEAIMGQAGLAGQQQMLAQMFGAQQNMGAAGAPQMAALQAMLAQQGQFGAANAGAMSMLGGQQPMVVGGQQPMAHGVQHATVVGQY
mmetsp:Transcript_102678/g.295629  ORF Transcript_102678/g.295629 Transcript_102678/m.295629 type:complete len:279 (+) Transcript_102678:46-882(+)